MDDKDKNFDDLNLPLILTDSNLPLILTKESEINSDKKIELLKINNLLKLKYLSNIKSIPLKSKINLDKDFISFKNTKKEIDYDIKEKISVIRKTIHNQEIELKKLHYEKKLLDQNKIQSDIIEKQQKLINNHKQNSLELKSNLIDVEKKLKENIIYNKKFLINNDELKKSISRYVIHNKKLQNNIKQLKTDYSETTFTKSQIDEMIDKIKFYQEENVRLSSEINNVQKNYELIKNNFTKIENEKNNIYKSIHKLNNSLIKGNIVGSSFVNENTNEDSVNSKVFNDIKKKDLQKKDQTFEQNNDLDDEINNIFN